MQEAMEGAAAPHFTTNLNLPARSLSALSCGCASARQLQRWLQGLQLDPESPRDRHRRSGLLRAVLSEIPRWQAPAARRLQLLELLRGWTLASAEQLALQRLADARHQTPELRRDLLTALILLQHLAESYASVTLQLCEKPVWLRRGKLALSLQRAQDACRRQIHICALFQLAVPKGCWRRLQTLAQVSRQRKLASAKVADPQHQQGRERVDAPYLHSALFASANPQQLDQVALQSLWDATGRWSRAAKIVDHCDHPQPALLACLALDQAPIPAARLAHCKVDPRHFCAPRGWQIDVRAPLRQLQKQLRKNPDPLLQSVRDLWAGERQRNRRRTATGANCQLVFGISALHRQLGAPAARPNTRFHSGADLRYRHLAMEVDAVDFASGRTLRDYEVALRTPPAAARRERPLDARLLDASTLGAGLRLPQESAAHLRAGELLGIHVGGRWRLAVIRWQCALPDCCRAGIEFLPGEPDPVQVRRLTHGGRASDLIPALRLRTEGAAESLLLPVPLFKSYDAAQILHGGGCQPVTLNRQSCTGGNFARFEYC